MKKIALFIFICFSPIVFAGEPPQQMQIGKSNANKPEIQYFDDCSNEECHEYAKTARDIILDPIVYWSVCVECIAQSAGAPRGCGCTITAAGYLCCLACLNTEDKKSFKNDFSYKLVQQVKESLRFESAKKYFPCLRTETIKKKE